MRIKAKIPTPLDNIPTKQKSYVVIKHSSHYYFYLVIKCRCPYQFNSAGANIFYKNQLKWGIYETCMLKTV